MRLLGETKIIELIDSLFLDGNDNAKEKIINFTKELKKIGVDEKYSLERNQHLGYIPYLVSIRESLHLREYEKALKQLQFMAVENIDYLRQPRVYVNIIYILEKIQKE